jgi:hypothetical protein
VKSWQLRRKCESDCALSPPIGPYWSAALFKRVRRPQRRDAVKASDRDRMLQRSTFALSASLVALSLLAIGVAILAVPGALLYVVTLPFEHPKATVGFGALVCVGLIRLCWRRRWATVGGVLTGLGIALLLSVAPMPARSFSRWAADLADVAYYHADLRRLADASRRRGESPALGVLTLDGFGTLTSGLALDPSGEIILPAVRRSRAWIAASAYTELSIESMNARHIIGNYYAWFHD